MATFKSTPFKGTPLLAQRKANFMPFYYKKVGLALEMELVT